MQRKLIAVLGLEPLAKLLFPTLLLTRLNHWQTLSIESLVLAMLSRHDCDLDAIIRQEFTTCRSVCSWDEMDCCTTWSLRCVSLDVLDNRYKQRHKQTQTQILILAGGPDSRAVFRRSRGRARALLPRVGGSQDVREKFGVLSARWWSRRKWLSIVSVTKAQVARVGIGRGRSSARRV